MFHEKLTNYRPCSRILRNELVILRITGLLLFTDHAEKFFPSRFTASENRRSLFTENKLSELIIFLVVFDCESGVRRSNLILLYFWRGFGVSQFVLFFISQDYKISLPLSTSDAFPEKQLLVSQLSWTFSVLISWNRFC